MSDIQKILKEAAKDVLTDETLNQITEAFNNKVEETVNERVQLEVQNALDNQDKDYSTKLEKLVEAIDDNHSKKLLRIVQRLDENHKGKLINVIKKFDKDLKVEAKKYKEELTNQLSNYLDLALEKAIPKEQIQEAVENSRSKNQLEKIRRIVAVSDGVINEQVREALEDGKKKIDQTNQRLQTLEEQNRQLQEKARQSEAQLLLERKTSHLPKHKKEYITKMLKDKDVEYINENFDYAVRMFERDEKNNVIRERTNTETKTKNVDRPVSSQKKENFGDDDILEENNNPINEFVQYMKQKDRS